MICEQELAAALGDDVQVCGAYQILQTGEAGLRADQIEARLGGPEVANLASSMKTSAAPGAYEPYSRFKTRPFKSRAVRLV